MPAGRQGRLGWPAECWVEGLTWAVEGGLKFLLVVQLRGVAVAWLLPVCSNQSSAQSLGPQVMRELSSRCLSRGLLI